MSISILCRLGLHKWKPVNGMRRCLRCGREEKLVYNMLDYDWEETEEMEWKGKK